MPLRFQWHDCDTKFTCRRSSKIRPKIKSDQKVPSLKQNVKDDLGEQLFTVNAYTATETGNSEDYSYDTDSYVVLIDNHASRSILHSIHDFQASSMVPTDATVGGIGGQIKATMIGTIIWTITDDDGRQQSIKIPKSLYTPTGKDRILSPQH